MERKNEVVLQNTTLENVLRYLFDKLKRLGGTQIERTTADGTIYGYCIQNIFPSNTNKIEVRYTTVITPQGNVEKSHGYWQDLIAMSFEGFQLQTNTVLLKAECDHPFIVPTFDAYWTDILKSFGAETVQPSDLQKQAENLTLLTQKAETYIDLVYDYQTCVAKVGHLLDKQIGSKVEGMEDVPGRYVYRVYPLIPSGPYHSGDIEIMKWGNYSRVSIISLSPAFLEVAGGWIGQLPRDGNEWLQAMGIKIESPVDLLVQTKSINQKTGQERQRGQSGRPNFPDDKWAWQQVNTLNRPLNDVYKEWYAKIKSDPKRCEMIDPKRQFNRIARPKWGNKPGQNI